MRVIIRHVCSIWANEGNNDHPSIIGNLHPRSVAATAWSSDEDAIKDPNKPHAKGRPVKASASLSEEKVRAAIRPKAADSKLRTLLDYHPTVGKATAKTTNGIAMPCVQCNILRWPNPVTLIPDVPWKQCVVHFDQQ